MGNSLDGIHALYMNNYVNGQILHLKRKGLAARVIASKLGISTSYAERIIRRRFGAKGTISGYETLAHWKGEAIE